MRVRTVCFDVGETLIDETRHWGEWADFLGVPRLTLFATLGMTMWRGEPHRRVFDLFRPDLNLATARRQRQALGWRHDFLAEDLYPDAPVRPAGGVAKPDAGFFAKIVAVAGEPAHHIAYVGDRLDNDVLPARAAGMLTVFLRRGPWRWMHAEHPDVAQADLRLDGLARLPDALASL